RGRPNTWNFKQPSDSGVHGPRRGIGQCKHLKAENGATDTVAILKGPRMVTQPTNADWLALTVEDALEPDLPICDPHHHLWDLRPDRIAPRYLLDEILADVRGGHNVVSTVFIECGA